MMGNRLPVSRVRWAVLPLFEGLTSDEVGAWKVGAGLCALRARRIILALEYFSSSELSLKNLLVATSACVSFWGSSIPPVR
jgi:hypothetical protein